MSKSPKILDSKQLNLFELLQNTSKNLNMPNPGDLDISSQVSGIIARAIKNSPLSRYHIAARMSEMLGREITKAQLDSYTAEAKCNHRFPLEYLPAFIEAIGDRSLIKFICEKCSGYYIENPDTLRLELGKIAEEERALRERKKVINSLLEGGL